MKRRVLVVSPYFYPEAGGLEKYAFTMAQELSYKENEVVVLCMTKGNERIEEIGEIKVYRVKPRVIISNTPLSLKFMLKAASIIRNVDIVIAHTPVPFAVDVASFLAKLRGIPIKIVYHTVGLKKNAGLVDIFARLYSATLERFTLRRAEIIAVSRTVWEYLQERGYNSKISFPMINIAKKSSKNNEYNNRNIILFVGQLGRYHKFKNLDLLIETFSKLSLEFPEWELWIVGGGDLLDEYRRLALKLGVGSRVRFFGRITCPKELARIYSRSSLLVLPSSFDSFGMVVAEALTFSIPVVISPRVGARILVESGKNGIILRNLSMDSLKETLRFLMDNPKILRKLSSRSISRVSV